MSIFFHPPSSSHVHAILFNYLAKKCITQLTLWDINQETLTNKEIPHAHYVFDKMSHSLRFGSPHMLHRFHSVSQHPNNKPTKMSKLTIQNCSAQPQNANKLVAEVKEKLEKKHSNLPLGKNGRDDEEMILWFLKDRKYSVDETVYKLNKAIRWRSDFGIAELSEESVKNVADTGKAYMHDYNDVHNRPVMIVEAAKHIPGKHNSYDDEKLCAFLIEKAISKLPDGKQEILVIIDLRGFGTQNADMKFVTFVFDAFYYYYPRRLGEVLFVDAPFIFKPLWQIVKPLIKSYASLVKFCSVKNVREEYFTSQTVPTNFRN